MKRSRSINEAEIRDLEFRYRDATRAEDLGTVQTLTADPCIVIGGSGAMLLSSLALAEMMKSGEFRLNAYQVDPDDEQFRELSDSVALFAYKVRQEFELNGRPGISNAYNASVWIRNEDSWECAVHSESVIDATF